MRNCVDTHRPLQRRMCPGAIHADLLRRLAAIAQMTVVTIAAALTNTIHHCFPAIRLRSALAESTGPEGRRSGGCGREAMSTCDSVSEPTLWGSDENAAPRRLSISRNSGRSIRSMVIPVSRSNTRASAGNFGAKAAVDAAVRLQQLGRAGDMGRALSAYADLRTEIERVKPFLYSLGMEDAA